MKIMGLSDFAHQLSWYFTAFVLFLWIAISSTLVTKGSFLPKTDGLILFLYFFFFAMATVNLCFLVSVFFSNSKLAAIIGPVILFVTVLPKYIFFGSNSNEAVVAKFVASLLPATAFTFGAETIVDYEYANVGVQFENIQDGNFSMYSVLLMLFFDIFIYGFLAWYLDQVIPHEFGVVKHPLFLFFPNYWIPFIKRFYLFHPYKKIGNEYFELLNNPQSLVDCGYFKKLPPEMVSVPINTNFTPNTESDNIGGEDQKQQVEGTEVIEKNNSKTTYDDNNFEKIPNDMYQHVKVITSGLAKTYPNGKKAVNDFSIAMLEGQITCLLGHNGAGKSSVIAMITGLHTITNGQCNIFGYEVPTDLSEIRKLTGICPQQNVLFPSLTVKEHLMFFGSIKGIHGKILQDEVLNLIHEIGLIEKIHTPSSSLSGGMKRKLQLAMALIGGSKFVLLDEPTSGEIYTLIWDIH